MDKWKKAIFLISIFVLIYTLATCLIETKIEVVSGYSAAEGVVVKRAETKTLVPPIIIEYKKKIYTTIIVVFVILAIAIFSGGEEKHEKN